MQNFACPACGERTIGIATKLAATSFEPARCGNCGARIYPSGKKTYLLRSLEAFIVTMIVILALIDFSWGLVGLALLAIAAMETLVVFVVPLVQLQRREPGR